MRQQISAQARFGSSGIRGDVTTVDTNLALALGRVLGGSHKEVVVGHDARLTGPALTHALMAGLLASGAHVANAGLIPTPALAHAARGKDLAVMVTASHNPAPDNGFKLITSAGSAPSPSASRAIEKALQDPPAVRAWDQTGHLEPTQQPLESYIEATLLHLATQGFEDDTLSELRLAVDCAHGAGSVATPRILSRLGASLSVLGGNPDGRFPDHPSEPVPEHLSNIRQILKDDTHALGIVHDGDADRTVFIAPGGQVLTAEQLLVVLARRRGDERLVVPVDAGGLIAQALPDVACVITPVGDIHLSQAVLDGRATLGAEPSGTWFVGDWSPAPEGPYMAALVACYLAHDPDLIMEAAGLPLPARVVRKIKTDRETDRDALIERAGKSLEKRLQPHHVITLDGLRLETEEGWVLLRKSGTEPLVRITAEADTEDHAQTLAQQAQNAVHEERTMTRGGNA